MRQMIRSTSVVALLVLLSAGVAWTGEEADASACAMCHDELAAGMTAGVHGLVKRNAPDCLSCHDGDAAKHMDEGDSALINIPAGPAGAEACLECHGRDLTTLPGSRLAHNSTTVACFECHTIHGSATLPDDADRLCASCHEGTVSSFARPFGHDLEGGGLQCVSCHDPHAGRGRRSLRSDRAGEGPCVTCHSEKRGPFVFGHLEGVAGDCTTCHEAHGSSNPNGLRRARVAQLCLECHSALNPGLLGSQAVSTHDLRSPRYRNCTVCHVAIHGSNTSPTLLR